MLVNDINKSYKSQNTISSLTYMVLRIFFVKSHCPQSQSSEPESEQTVLLPAAPLSLTSRTCTSVTSSIHNPRFSSETRGVFRPRSCETGCISCVKYKRTLEVSLLYKLLLQCISVCSVAIETKDARRRALKMAANHSFRSKQK